MEINQEPNYTKNFVKKPYKWQRKEKWKKIKEQLGEDYDRIITRMPKQYMRILGYLGKQEKKDKFKMLRRMIMQYYELVIRSRIDKHQNEEQK